MEDCLKGDSESRQFATFSADGLFFGLDVAQVQEVVKAQEMTPVPLSDHTITGLINLRGQIITALDLRKCLGLSERQLAKPPMNVIVKIEEELNSYLVDEIGDVLTIESSSLKPPPPTLPTQIKSVVTKVCQLNDKLLLVLDPNAI